MFWRYFPLRFRIYFDKLDFLKCHQISGKIQINNVICNVIKHMKGKQMHEKASEIY